jgi:F-type H+-transporting ATPase subunit delta
MTSNRVARRYAEAMLELAEERKQIERVAEDFDLLRRTIAGSRDLASFLRSPIIPKEKKRSILNALFSSRVSGLVVDFLKLLTDKRREDLLGQVAEEFARLRDERQGIVNVEVRAALELTKEQHRALERQFEGVTGKKVRVSVSVDKQLLGGLVARVGDTVFDGSIRRQLELLRERFAEHVGPSKSINEV